MGDHRSTELNPTCGSLVETHTASIASLPEPGEEWRWCEVDLPRGLLSRLNQKGVINQTMSKFDPENDERGGLYTVDKTCYEVATEKAEYSSTLPCCTSTGFTNDGGTLRCKRCGQSHDRETIREVLG